MNCGEYMDNNIVYWIVLVMTIIAGFLIPSLLQLFWEEIKKYNKENKQMTNLEQLKHEGILDMISQLGTLTDDELEELVQSTIVGIA